MLLKAVAQLFFENLTDVHVRIDPQLTVRARINFKDIFQAHRFRKHPCYSRNTKQDLPSVQEADDSHILWILELKTLRHPIIMKRLLDNSYRVKNTSSVPKLVDGYVSRIKEVLADDS